MPGGRPPRKRATAAEQEYFRRLGRASLALARTERPPADLNEALARMEHVERIRGIDVRDPEVLERWPDRHSHIAYLKAVRTMAGKEQATHGNTSAEDA